MPSREIDKNDHKFWTHWNAEAKQFFLQLSFKLDKNSNQDNMFQMQQVMPVGLSVQQNQPLNAYVQIRQPTQILTQPLGQPPMMLHLLPQ